jgi:hypothetical protein
MPPAALYDSLIVDTLDAPRRTDMLRLLGSTRRLCDGITRRDFLHLGGLATLGLGLGDFLRLQSSQAASPRVTRGFGKTKACILLFPYGSPPQHETFDPKPDALAEIQGEMKAISTSVPGQIICDHLPRIAKVMDRVCVVRSLTHPYPEHGVAYAVSGMPTYTPALETRPRDPHLWPFIGSLVSYLDEKRQTGVTPAVPRNIGLPWLLNCKTDLVPLAGPYAGFLGQAYDPVWADFTAKGTRTVPRYTDGQKQDFLDPYGGITPADRFHVVPEGGETATAEQLADRLALLRQFDASRRQLDQHARDRNFEHFQDQAFTLLTSSRMRSALDVQREPLVLRERYGMTLFGQACLAARRLVEAGARFITVFWDGYGQFSGCAWDTHANHYPRLKEYLLPGFDLAYSALLEDLDARGLLDETLVLWLSEHGRTPKIDPKPKGAGRHHWSKAYSIALAGGGTPRGTVVGSTDRNGGEVRDTPISPKDILATTFHLLGIDATTNVIDPQGRPVPIAGDGVVRAELIA